ncbi:Gfo/Idh/MocA family protein [Actinopolyspora saharensis]|uniref:Predicted dehydrogenase n=1 Tax=Actinopolyspora saharensis TaxID=995062 RepID=A0A1H1EHZ2_9ACTN|nr:Gfo/Idh/MocA family oxidoreductase [Actinopolyspora saharensis]SDQ88244.1 Predicted dehydrogenase [Actinopolyspora saharensis]
MSDTEPLGIGLVGHAFMGAAHSQAWRTVGRVFAPPLSPRMSVLCGRDADGTAAAARRLGWARAETDWRKLIASEDVDLVDICTPGDTHPEIAIAALEAGKHVLCEKPLANSVSSAEAMAEAALRANERGVRSMVGFNYRRVPALALARRLVLAGRIGKIRHVRAQYLQDFIVDPESPMMWRLDRERAGSGALGDIGTHIVDLAQFVTAEHITGVSGLTSTFVPERPLGDGSGRYGTVTVDDAAAFLARFSGGALATFEASRFATGRKNAMRLEINGSAGSLAFDFESMNELSFHDHGEDASTAGFRRILVTEPEHPYLHAWWPPGHGLGYEHTFTHQARDVLEAIGNDQPPAPSFADGLAVQRVLDAVEHSAANSSTWTEVPAHPAIP